MRIFARRKHAADTCAVARSNDLTRLEKRFSDRFTGMRIVCSRRYHCKQTSRLKHGQWTKVDSIEVCYGQVETAILGRSVWAGIVPSREFHLSSRQSYSRAAKQRNHWPCVHTRLLLRSSTPPSTTSGQHDIVRNRIRVMNLINTFIERRELTKVITAGYF